MNFKRIQQVTTAALIACTAASAYATETRVGVLRYNGGIEDETLAFTYPGQISKYKVALIELGTKNTGTVGAYGAAFADAGALNIGVALSRTDWLFTSGWTNHTPLSSSSISLLDLYETEAIRPTNSAGVANANYLATPARPIEVLLGFNVGAGTLGVRLSYADYKNKTDSTTGATTVTSSQTAQQSQIAVGFHTGGLDVAVTLDPSANQKRTTSAAGVESSQSIKGSAFAVDGRWIETDSASSPYAKARVATRSFKATATGAKESSAKFTDQIVFLEGGYVAMREAQGPKLFTGAQIVQSSSKGPTYDKTTNSGSFLNKDDTAKIDTLVLNGTLSGEAQVYGGFGLLAGMSYVMFGDITTKDNTTNTEVKNVKTFDETSDDALWSLGMFYRADAMRVDASYSKEIFYNGPYMITGIASQTFVGRISASYAF